MLGYVWIEVRRETEGAKIFIDNKMVGYAPRVPYHKAYGVIPDIKHTVRLEYPGYENYITTFTIPTVLSAGVYRPYPGGHWITATMRKLDVELPLFESSEKAEVGTVYRVGTTGTRYSKLTPEQGVLVESGEKSAMELITENIEEKQAIKKKEITNIPKYLRVLIAGMIVFIIGLKLIGNKK